MKRITSAIFLIAIAIILTFSLTACGGEKLSDERISEILGTNSLPFEYTHAQFIVDMSDLQQVIGDADYVFVCKIKGYISTQYDEFDFPTTAYSIEVIENIKGELRMDEDIVLKKAGGISKNHKAFSIFTHDSLPKINSIYVVSVYGLSTGDILASGENTNLLLLGKDSYESDSNYIKVIEAYENEIVHNRTRHQSKYDVNYSN